MARSTLVTTGCMDVRRTLSHRHRLPRARFSEDVDEAAPAIPKHNDAEAQPICIEDRENIKAPPW